MVPVVACLPLSLRRSRPWLRPVAGLLLAALALGGCSAVRLAYNNADFFIEDYADEYLGLDRSQLRGWSPTLDAALGRHRTEELPYLAAFFETALAGARDGFSEAGVDCLLDQFERLYRRHARLAVEAAAPLLADLRAQQIDDLAAYFAERAREDQAEPGPEVAARRARKRAERYADNLRWWTGALDSRQRGIVRDVTRRMPDTAPAWYAYRAAKREELIAVLRSDPSAARIEDFLVDWLVEFSDLPPALAAARPELRAAIAQLLLRLQPTFSEAQRERLIRRLQQLRDDFLKLQGRPRMAPVAC